MASLVYSNSVPRPSLHFPRKPLQLIQPLMTPYHMNHGMYMLTSISAIGKGLCAIRPGKFQKHASATKVPLKTILVNPHRKCSFGFSLKNTAELFEPDMLVTIALVPSTRRK
jgi:hypothetical protein